MSAQILHLAPRPEGPQAEPPRELPKICVQLDFGGLLARIERTMRWLDRNQIVVRSFSVTTFEGGKVCVKAAPRLHTLLRDELHSRGHRADASGRVERIEARDPATGVLIFWDEPRKPWGRHA